MEIILAVSVIIVVIGLAAAWIRHTILQAAPKKDDQSLVLLQNQIQAIQTSMTQTMELTRKSMDDRLDGAARVIQNVSKQLGQLDESTKKLFDVGKDISSLQDILRSPKLRGNLSELFLQDLLAQILPAEHYHMQHTFRGGETVDAVIEFKAGMVPIDAKFPLENFRRIIQAANDDDRKAAKKVFIQDVKKHIDAIARKYICPDEGTFHFALMYVPAENVYYETIIKDDEFGGEKTLFQYALESRVIPVSPNSFFAYLQTVLLGLKGMRVEESAREIMDQLERLRVEYDKFAEAFRLIGQHLDNSLKKYQEADKRLGKFEGKMLEIDGAVKVLEATDKTPLSTTSIE